MIILGKHKKKHSNKSNSGTNNFDLNNIDMSQMNNLLNNFNPNQLAGMLNNIDMNQISSMLQGMGGSSDQGVPEPAPKSNDKRLELLHAMKPLVDAEKSKLIDSIIGIYNLSKVIKK